MCCKAWSVDVIPNDCFICSMTLLFSLMAVGTCVDEHALFISLGDAENIVGSDDVDALGVLVLKVPTLLDAAAELLLLVLLVVRWMTGGDVGIVGVMRNGNLNVPLAKLDNIS